MLRHDPAEVYKLAKSVSSSLLNHRGPDLVESLETGCRRWSIATISWTWRARFIGTRSRTIRTGW